METVILLTLSVVLLLLLVWYWSKAQSSEHFDTYHNHDIGAAEVYHTNDVRAAQEYANYAWSERDPSGLTVYDKYYMGYLLGMNSDDAEYAYRDLQATGEENVYDSKFSIRDAENRFFMCGNRCLQDMGDSCPATEYDWHSGETSFIVQKNY
jgi:hypothetical protein